MAEPSIQATIEWSIDARRRGMEFTHCGAACPNCWHSRPIVGVSPNCPECEPVTFEEVMNAHGMVPQGTYVMNNIQMWRK